MDRYLIVNADDLGYDENINRGIFECHVRGILTSASFMVTGHAAAEAAAASRDHPELSIGLHWDVWGEDEREFDLSNERAVRDEFQRQLDEFERLLGRLPTHVDSHRHAHREKHLMPLFRELVAPLGVPLRGDGHVNFVGGFYAQWEWRVTNLEYVSVPFLERMLREEVPDGWTEFSCHPGYVAPNVPWVYSSEREAEIATLTHPHIRDVIDQLGIRLSTYSHYAAAALASERRI